MVASRPLRIHVYHERAEAIAATLPGHEVVLLHTRDELAAAIGELEVLFAPEPPRDGWAGAHRLRLIQLLGVGADHFLPSPDLPAHVEVAGARGEFADDVAEHALAMMLALQRRLPALLADQRAKRWRQAPRGALAGQPVTIVGAGAIGQRIALLCAAFAMPVTLVSRTGHDGTVAVAQLDDALAGARFLVLAAPLTPATRGLIDASRLARLAPGAFVVAVGRGGVLDEAALLGALTSGHLAGAALDVLVDEPPAPDHPLWTAPGLILTPHVAGYGERYIERCAAMLLDNIRRLETGEPRVGLVDRSLLY